MPWQENRRLRPERKYAPSPLKVVPEEADNPDARSDANEFVDRIYREMDESERGPYAITPTSGYILERYQAVEEGNQGARFPERTFTLKEAYGAAKRNLLSQKELLRLNPFIFKKIAAETNAVLLLPSTKG
jgi:hypothetical protein